MSQINEKGALASNQGKILEATVESTYSQKKNSKLLNSENGKKTKKVMGMSFY